MNWLILAGILAMLGALVYALLFAQSVRASRIDKEHVWLKRICPAYLEGLPEWMGKR